MPTPDPVCAQKRRRQRAVVHPPHQIRRQTDRILSNCRSFRNDTGAPGGVTLQRKWPGIDFWHIGFFHTHGIISISQREYRIGLMSLFACPRASSVHWQCLKITGK
jgi:hypothetical protein